MKNKREYIYSVRIFGDIDFFTREDDWNFKDAEACLSNSEYVGWFNSKEDAFKGAMDSKLIPYALIEKVMSGIDSGVSERWFFKFNFEKKRYEEIEITGRFKNLLICWTIR